MRPTCLPQARSGYRMGNGALIDSMIYDGLWDVYNDFHMGTAAEMVAAKYGISREDQDAFAAESHSRAAAATAQGAFRDEILLHRNSHPQKRERPPRSLPPTNQFVPGQPWKPLRASSPHSKKAAR